MTQYGEDNQYGREGFLIDEYGNPVRQTDEYRNLVHFTTGHHHGTGTTVARAVAGTGHTGTGGTYPHNPYAAPIVTRAGGYEDGGGYDQHGGISTRTLHHSGSGSSSSSEDDGQGGRRKKKGVMEKIKDMLPGGGHSTDEQHRVSYTTTAGGSYGDKHEKKGTTEKTKEKLPGDH